MAPKRSWVPSSSNAQSLATDAHTLIVQPWAALRLTDPRPELSCSLRTATSVPAGDPVILTTLVVRPRFSADRQDIPSQREPIRCISVSRGLTRDMIGLPVRIEGDGYVELEMDNTMFSRFERPKLPGLIGREGGNQPGGEIGFLIEDIDGEAERLRGLGVEILSGPVGRPWHERMLHIAERHGNIIEFTQSCR